MDSELQRYLISSGVLTAVLIAIVQFVLRMLENRRQRRVDRPRTDAELRKSEADYDAMVLETQRKLVEGWQRELEHRDTKIKELEERFKKLDANLDDSHEQNDLLARQLTACHETNKQLSEQKRILLTHLRATDEWTHRYYKAGHPPGMEPPPQMKPFETP